MSAFVLDETNQQILATAKQLAVSRFDPTDAESIEFAYQIAMYHFLLGQEDTALLILAPFQDIPFSGDFDVWTFVEYGLLLAALISMRQQDEEGKLKALRVIYTAIESEEDPEGAKEFIAELCDRGAEYGAEIEEAMLQQDAAAEVWARVSQVIDWLYVAMHNRSTTFKQSDVLREIESERQKITALVAAHGLCDVYPFSQLQSTL